MNIATKAMNVEQVYYEACWEHDTHSEGCYAIAVDAAQNLGGIETSNTNDGNSTWSFAPSITFVFDDSSSVYVTVGGVFAY